MTTQVPHIIRQQEENLISEVIEALAQPENFPVLFYIWGIGGVGKSTLLNRLEEKCETQASILKFSFGTADETPLSIMEKLYKQLPKLKLLQKDIKDIMRQEDEFSATLQTFKSTLTALETTPIEGKEVVSKEQIDQVRLLAKLVANGTVLGTQTFATGSLSLLAASATTATVNKAVDMAMEGTVAALLLKDNLLLKHPTTKKNLKLQELMESPLQKLTDAFIESLLNYTKYSPLILVIDTYEKATIEVDAWLRQTLLSNVCIKTNQVRIVVAGRYRLSQKVGWKELPLNHNLVREIRLKEFKKEETQQYLEGIGLSNREDINRLHKSTNGLPFHLDLIRQEKQEGEPINYSEEISDRLLKGLNKEQKKLVQLAACCRWFDQALVEWLAINHNLDFQTSADRNMNCFDWLKKIDIVEYTGDNEGCYFLKDVARDAIRKSLWQLDRGKTFRQICCLLQKYFEEQADQEVASDATPPEKYENLDWCHYTSEAIYYTLFAMRREECRNYFLTHFFASRHFNQIDLVMLPLSAILAESEISNNQLLPNENQKFIESIRLLFPLGWLIMNLPHDGDIKFNNEIVQRAKLNQIEAVLSGCIAQVEVLEDGLAKFMGLMCKFLRCSSDQKVEILQYAQYQAQLMNSPKVPEFSSNLFFRIGEAFRTIHQYTEALANYDKALQINHNNPNFYNNKGAVLGTLERPGEALEMFNKATQIDPDRHSYWNNKALALLQLELCKEALENIDRAIQLDPKKSDYWETKGLVLIGLGRHQEAVNAFDKAIEIDSRKFNYWLNRGVALSNLEQNQEALDSFDRAIRINHSSFECWHARGSVLVDLEQYKEAFISINKAIELNAKDSDSWNTRGIILTRMKKYNEALQSFNKAIKLGLENTSDIIQYQINRGVLFAWMGQYAKAIELCDAALDEAENNVSVFYGKACCYALKEDFNEAIQILEFAINQEPDEMRRRARKDPEFNGIKKDIRFQSLINM